jgi:nitrogen regulatory protein P-II 2
MKLITAIVTPENLNNVKKHLFAAKIMRFVVSDCFGHSDEEATVEMYRGVALEVDLKRKAKIVMAVNEDFVDKAINAIIEGGRTGKSKGAGKIFIQNLERCISIATGEEGERAIGGYDESRS